MNGGYVMVDCKGMNLLAQSSQTINGLFAASKSAISTGKPILANNCVYGEGVPTTPIAVMAIEGDGNIIFTMSGLQITIANDDTVTITTLAQSTKSATVRK